jgi:basic amino acid/polyamine antiporter, APA family
MQSNSTGKLQASLGSFQFLTIGLGTIMGIAWAILLGNWLDQAAPLGAVAGFVIGGTGMLLVAACYAELATALPRTGGDVVWAMEVLGPRIAFAVGWFLVFMAIATTSFEAISLGWFLQTLFPALGNGPRLRVNGVELDTYSVLIQVIGMVAITIVNYHGARTVSRVQDCFTVLKALGVTIFLAAAFATGTPANLKPPLTPSRGESFVWGTLWIAVTAPIWFGGFQVIPQAIEERNAGTSLRTVGRLTVSTVAIGIVFYCSIVLAASLTQPWRILVQAPVPAIAAVNAAVSSTILAKGILVAVALGIIAVWNSCFLWATRILVGMARNGLLPPLFARINRFGAPGPAAIFCGIVAFAGLALGRGGLIPIMNMDAISLALSFAATCWATAKLRRDRPYIDRPYRVPGGNGMMLAALVTGTAIALAAILGPLALTRGVPLEWILMAAWGSGGALVWCAWRRSPAA